MDIIAILLVLGAYLLGSLSFAVIVSKALKMDDPRSYGSGNPGATNVLRSGKKKAAALTLLGDALKGLLAVALARWLYHIGMVGELTVAVVALAVLLGHMWPLFFGFKGGKGVATAVGVLYALSWPVALICTLVWLLLAFGLKISSVAALVATVLSPMLAMYFIKEFSWTLAILVIALLVLYRHKSNIQNLLAGKESKIGSSK